jgi:hypothetical protein
MRGNQLGQPFSRDPEIAYRGNDELKDRIICEGQGRENREKTKGEKSQESKKQEPEKSKHAGERSERPIPL